MSDKWSRGQIVAKAVKVEEETEAPILTAGPQSAGEAAPKGRRKVYANMRRELDDKELASPAVTRFLADEVERLESDLAEHKEYRNKFHEADKKVSLLDDKLKTVKAFEIISTGCLTGGGVLIGLGPKMWDNPMAAGFIGLAGVVFIGLGVAAKVAKS